MKIKYFYPYFIEHRVILTEKKMVNTILWENGKYNLISV